MTTPKKEPIRTLEQRLDEEIEAAMNMVDMSRDWRINEVAFLKKQILEEWKIQAAKSNGQH